MTDKIADELRAWAPLIGSGYECPAASIAMHRAADELDAKDKRIAELEAGGWQPIETAPDFERVIVAGWQPKSGTVAGYWWMHEDDIVAGRPPSALLWHPFPMPPPAPVSAQKEKAE
ncbi:hypothetical protein J1C56_01760 [Aminobacter anthyllidis]|uniref:DUF551 domain-containing protein n=1 Tax=Aminobacter anthyllidis TaxID=1035067 RepID=A0A9X1A759_9HYPH|nr:hypothetical protein [Aminobacter anthyllidis]MBT1154310.1 hypothetical protein [Aminobacter anthyllidis]